MENFRPPAEGEPSRGGVRPQGHQEKRAQRPRWFAGLLIATSLLAIMAVGSYLLLGRELFQRPLLIVAVVSAWLGALAGLAISSDTG